LDEKIVYAVLGVTVTIYLVAFRRVILRTDYVFLLLALVFLSSSVVIDIFQRWMWRLGQWEFFFEDGGKWLGIACWCSYYVQTANKLLIGSLRIRKATITQSDDYSFRAIRRSNPAIK
jgi:hypothetical protein